MVNEHGHLEHIYYGAHIVGSGVDALRYKRNIVRGSLVLSSQDDSTYSLDDVPLEWSGIGRGDYRNSPAQILMPDATYTNDFCYLSHEYVDGDCPMGSLPTAYGAAQTLIVTLKDSVMDVRVKLFYSVYEESNVITRRAVLQNNEASPLHLQKFMSMMLDLPQGDYDMTTFDGDWISEANRHLRPVESGIYINESTTGASSNRHNSGVLISGKHTSQQQGIAYGFNLIYSGNHHTAVEKAPCGLVRVMCGISPHCFDFTLKHGEQFETPEAVMTFSEDGFNGMSQNFHRFVNQNVVRGDWKGRERPVLINNWEAHFFRYKQGKLMRLARRAKKLGVELFVLDDGWFSNRNTDTCGLGDYNVNRKKLPCGIDGLAERIEKLGMKFGLWFEPESVNPDSDLYRNHPEYAIKIPSRTPALGRHQLLLDLTNPFVRDYIVDNVSAILDSAKISYVKWDMNRHMSDMYSASCPAGEFFHRYTMGLYDVLGRIFLPRSHILVEGCASGGDRFDLGILCFCQQIWASDDTDPIERVKIQSGLSYLYPQSTMGAHVSQSPHQQTLRHTPISTRFHVASYGCLGYEMDLGELTPLEKKDVAEQISFYKKHRKTLQFGTFYRFDNKPNQWCFEAVNSDKSVAISTMVQGLATAAPSNDMLPLIGLDASACYSLKSRPQRVYVGRFGSLIKHLLPIKLKPDGLVLRTLNRHYSMLDGEQSLSASGAELMAGVQLDRQFIGTGYQKDIRMLGDFGSNMYIIEREG